MTDRTLDAGDLEAPFHDLVMETEVTGRRALFLRNGRGVAILASYDEWIAMKDTIDVLGDPALLRDIESAETQLRNGEQCSLEELA